MDGRKISEGENLARLHLTDVTIIGIIRKQLMKMNLLEAMQRVCTCSKGKIIHRNLVLTISRSLMTFLPVSLIAAAEKEVSIIIFIFCR